MFADQIIEFLLRLRLPFRLPKGMAVLDAITDQAVLEVCQRFYRQYYNDQSPRYMLIGINPGRHGGGVTGIPFTDPVRLEKDCGIENPWPKKQELSAAFMYEMMAAYGGVRNFYQDLYITAVSPLGFTKDGRNLNYYDDKWLKEKIRPFAIRCMEEQLAFGIRRDVCFCIGEGENLKYLQALNESRQWFERLEALPHPRFIMQYRLKDKAEYIQRYVTTFQKYTGV